MKTGPVLPAHGQLAAEAPGTVTALPELIRQLALLEPGRTIIEEVGGGTISYAEFYELTSRWHGGLVRLGLGRDDRVVTLVDGGVAALAAWIGVGWTQAIEVPINPEYRGGMLANLIRKVAPRMIISLQRNLPRLHEVATTLGPLEAVIVPDAAAADDSYGLPVIRGAEFFVASDPAYVPREWDRAAILFTSGTTGHSKAVVVPWGQVAMAVSANFNGDSPGDYPDGGYYVPWPLYNVLGRGGFDTAVRLRLRMVLRDGFSKSQFWRDIDAHRCTHTVLPFIVPWLLMAAPGKDDADNCLVRAGVAPLTEDTPRFAARFGVKTSGAWASTEAGFPLSYVGADKPGCVGRPISGYEVRIVDEHDIEVPKGTVGELVVRHERPWRQMIEYFGDPEATLRVWRNGWYHTGDSFRQDEAGDFYFVGRLKDYVKTRGHNVSMAELEEQLMLHPKVLEVGCVGVPTALSREGGFEDEDIVAFVVLEDGAEADSEEIVAFASESLPKFMVPAQVRFIDELPRNDHNKMIKQVLRDLARSSA
jgi:carnitine-CoA ligase